MIKSSFVYQRILVIHQHFIRKQASMMLIFFFLVSGWQHAIPLKIMSLKNLKPVFSKTFPVAILWTLNQINLHVKHYCLVTNETKN